MVPIYTQLDGDDILIRAYTKCDTYQRNLVGWFTSDEFIAKSRETEALRTKVQLMIPDTDVSLVNWCVLPYGVRHAVYSMWGH